MPRKRRASSGSVGPVNSPPKKREPSTDRAGSVASGPSVGSLKSDLEAKYNDHTSNDIVGNVTHQISGIKLEAILEEVTDPNAKRLFQALLKGQSDSTNQIVNLTNLSKLSAAKNLRIVAGEVLQCSLGKRKHNSASSIFNNKRNTYTDRIEAGRKAFGFKREDLGKFQEFGNECINIRNGTVHFDTEEALDNGVQECAMALSYFEGLRKDEGLKNQIRVIDNYDKLKNELKTLNLELLPAPNENPAKSSYKESSKRRHITVCSASSTTASYKDIVAHS